MPEETASQEWFSDLNERIANGLSAPLEPSAGRATAWLIEWPECDTNPVRWWNPAHGWMRDASKALHFARKMDADCYLSTMKFGLHLKVTEHVFIGAEPQQPASAPLMDADSICGFLHKHMPDQSLASLAVASRALADHLRVLRAVPQGASVNPLDAAWQNVNALGGTGSTAEELAFVYGIERALSVIEELGGMDPATRSTLSRPECKS